MDLRASKCVSTPEDMVGCRVVWRRMLFWYGLPDADGDLETVVTWDPEDYRHKQRDEEARVHPELQ